MRFKLGLSRLTRTRSQLTFFFFQAEDVIRDIGVTGVQTCALPISKLPIVAAAGIGFFPLSVAVGGTWLAVNVAFRAMKAGRVRLRTWLAEVVQALQADLIAATDASLRDMKPEIVVGFRDHLAAAIAELDATLREAERPAAGGGGGARQLGQEL